MKKNTKTYILVAVVVLIWGLIGYKVLSTVNHESEKASLAVVSEFKPVPIKKKDTFSIVADYRDPFLGTIKKPVVKTIKKTSKPKIKKEAVPEINVLYTGHITDSNTKEKIFFVSINGQQQMMSINNTINEVTLISGNKSKIKVKVQKKVKTISLQE